MDVWTGFWMDSDAIGPGIRKIFHVVIDRRNHQMDVQRLFGVGPYRPNDRRTDRNIGHEMTIHNVHMDEISTGRFDSRYLRSELCKVSRQYRRRNADSVGHV